MSLRVSLDAEPPQQSAGARPVLPALGCTVLPAADISPPPPFPPGPLVDVGFWADPRDPLDDRPDPANFVDREWGATVVARAVAMYALSGFVESFELGYSWCRFGCSASGCDDGDGGGARGGYRKGELAASCDSPTEADSAAAAAGGRGDRLMGCCTLTDGTYVWPEGLAHYLSEHAVRPPEDFIAHALANLQALRSTQAGGRLRWEVDSGGRTVPLAAGTAAFLRDNTTLGIALLPSPEFRRSRSTRSSDGVCSCKTS